MAEEAPRIEDQEYEPSAEPKSSRAWLNLIVDAEKAFEDYQHRADNIDKLYANLGILSGNTRDRQFQLFWANVQVLGPSIYARPPIPVVVPKFKDRRPLYRTASELLERCTAVAFDMTNIDAVMMLLRDDLAIQARGVGWVRYETKSESDGDTEKVCIEHIDRKDFLHDPARNWTEVGWVARAAYMTRKEMRKRFYKDSGDAYKDAAYAVQKEARENSAADKRIKARVWEIWHKAENKVVWVTEGVDKLLDEGKPHLKLEGFFPCPRPAYSTVQRRSLVPVPDVVYYKDQLEEINELTGRIHALSDALKVRGFYPAGSSEIGDAVEAALKSVDDRTVLVPISNWAAFGQNGDPIIWLPLEMISTTLVQLVELRKQLIDDVYQIMGLSDIMRGATEKDETATAQNLKAQYGSVRIRDKQSELVRIARDLVRIAAEIMAENFGKKTLLDMSQMEIPTQAEQRKAIADLKAQGEAMLQQRLQQAQQNPEMMQQAQANPGAAQQMLEQASQQIAEQIKPQIAKIEQQPTIEDVMQFLRDQRVRPFVLDIESDSTIQADEQAEKQSRTEFVTALATLIAQFGPVLQTQPEMAPMVGEIIKFALAPYRAGRELEGKIEEAIEQMVARGQQPQPNPEADKAKAEAEAEKARQQFEMQKWQAEQQAKAQEMQRKDQADMLKMQAERENMEFERAGKAEENQARIAQINAAMQRDERKGALEERKLVMETEAMEREAAIKATVALQQADHAERGFEQQSALNAQKTNEARP